MTFIVTEEVTEETFTFEGLSMSEISEIFQFFINLFCFRFFFIAQANCLFYQKKKSKKKVNLLWNQI